MPKKMKSDQKQKYNQTKYEGPHFKDIVHFLN